MNQRNILLSFLGIVTILGVMSGCNTTSSLPSVTPSSEPITPTNEPVTPTSEPATPTPVPANQYSDDHVEILLDKTERLQELPEDLLGDIAEEGKEFIVFYFSVIGIKNVHITNMLGTRENRMTMVVNSGEEYSIVNGKITGVKVIDQTNITAGSELVEGSKCIFIFEVPEDTQPASLTIPYSYKQNMDDEDEVLDELKIEF